MLTDNKMRWGGLLENPWISKVQRSLLDYGSFIAIRKTLSFLSFENILDVGCGIGDYAAIRQKKYVGLDNSLKSITFAAQHHRSCFFTRGDALTLPFRDKSFDLSMMIEISHHLTDQDFKHVVLEMVRVTKKYILIEDSVRFKNQNPISSFFYNLDRGGQFRYLEEMKNILQAIAGTQLKEIHSYRTFPGFYFHKIFILEIQR